MALARGRRRTRNKAGGLSRWWSAKDRAAKFAVLVAAGQVIGAGGMAAGAGVGLTHLEARVHAAARFCDPPVIELADVPAGLHHTISTKLAPFETAWAFDPDLCAKVGRALETDPWVRRVGSVRRTADLRIVVRCAYRRPAALVQIDGEVYLVDTERVRLPGVYGYEAALPLIQGVASLPPAPGEEWVAADLAAGMTVARLLAPERFSRQITGIQVHNYQGRISPRAAHVVLASDRAGRLIYWGSAPGEEVEENTARQKIAILRDNFERYGRVDANRGPIDISVYPDRFIVRR